MDDICLSDFKTCSTAFSPKAKPSEPFFPCRFSEELSGSTFSASRSPAFESYSAPDCFNLHLNGAATATATATQRAESKPDFFIAEEHSTFCNSEPFERPDPVNMTPDLSFFNFDGFGPSFYSEEPTGPTDLSATDLSATDPSAADSSATPAKVPKRSQGRPSKDSVCHAWNMQSKHAVSRFRTWLSTAFQTPQSPSTSTSAASDSPDDQQLAFETWPPERLAAALQRYYAEVRTRTGARLAPATLYGIRSALAHHLNAFQHDESGERQPRRAMNLACDPVFAAANRALVIAASM